MKKINALTKKRIFWLGMHKLLVATELKRLRMLGYEVFNPPYLSSIIDQSATLDWSPPTDSTLPAEAIAILSKTNFFYHAIPPKAAEILNQYFEIVIVTIDPSWLKNLLSVYHGKVIYRVYGQPYRLSNQMVNNHLLDLISERENFWFCPHHEKTLNIEDVWLKHLNTKIIPYCLSDEVMALKDHWTFQAVRTAHESRLGLICPRILDHTEYGRSYRIIKQYFSDNQFKIFGVQIRPVPDAQVVGTLKREDFLKFFIKLRGFIYHYSEPTVCYLPPIEFMTLGGPVIFLKGCLLSRYFKGLSTPGEAQDLPALATLAQRLKRGDRVLSDEIIHSQEKVRALYDPHFVWPVFDKAMTEILNTDEVIPPVKLLYNHTSTKRMEEHSTEKSVVIAFHSLGPNIERRTEGDYYSAEGIIRVTGLMAKALAEPNQLIVTSRRRDFGRIHGFFASYMNDPSQLKILLVDKSNENRFLNKVKNKIKSICFNTRLLRKKIKKITGFLKNPKNKNLFLSLCFPIQWLRLKSKTSPAYVKLINQDKSISHLITPHYFLFPETYAVKKPTLLYLPDYLPHFYKNSLDMGDHWTWRYIAKKMTQQAKVILTNSNFTQNYLPNTVLKVKKEKIIYFPLPHLNQPQTIDDFSKIKNTFKNLPELFIFYPTRDRASKRLNDFLTIVNIVNNRLKKNNETRRVYGVLTTELLSKKQDDPYLIYLPTLSDLELTTVYKLSRALVFTSENEGNFPPQINEALYLNTPVIATNIPQITNELGQIAHSLQLINIGDCERFADAILYTIDNREKVLDTQLKVRDYAMKHFSYTQFSTHFLSIFS
jgi:glycosyltransferase involved in cell wall biosynthesis